jgi:hypothetical protein|tara:strand:- start:139 stop:324 length:186 start_codon:yes stop_codon:yes gene_type:complete
MKPGDLVREVIKLSFSWDKRRIGLLIKWHDHDKKYAYIYWVGHKSSYPVSVVTIEVINESR